MNSSRFAKKSVVITGGSLGIGFAIAEEFAEKGSDLHLIARNKENLARAKEKLEQKFPEVDIQIYKGDVSDLEGITKVIQEIGNSASGIHTIINNAGIEAYGKFEDISMEVLKNVLNVNYWGAVNVTKAALPFIKEETRGHIGFVSSVAGYLGATGYSSYAPTKFAMTGLAECLRMEMADLGIGVTIVFPPDTETPMLEREHIHQIPEARALSKNAKVISANLVANRFVTGIEKNKFEVFCNIESTWIRRIKVLLPKIYFNLIDGIVAKDRKKRLEA